jgi:hypothetical protein
MTQFLDHSFCWLWLGGDHGRKSHSCLLKGAALPSGHLWTLQWEFLLTDAWHICVLRSVQAAPYEHVPKVGTWSGDPKVCYH